MTWARVYIKKVLRVTHGSRVYCHHAIFCSPTFFRKLVPCHFLYSHPFGTTSETVAGFDHFAGCGSDVQSCPEHQLLHQHGQPELEDEICKFIAVDEFLSSYGKIILYGIFLDLTLDTKPRVLTFPLYYLFALVRPWFRSANGNSELILTKVFRA